jgi:hypothetical protein
MVGAAANGRGTDAKVPVWVSLGGLLVVWTGLLGWDLAAGRLPCLVAALALAAVAGLIARSGVESALVRRRAFAGQYLVPGGLLYRLLTGRVLILIRQGAQGLVLGLLLLVGALVLAPVEWGLLLADAVLFAALVAGLTRLLGRQVRVAYRQALARYWAVRLNAVLLWLAWVALMAFTPQTNYAGLRWEEVLAIAAGEPAVACDPVAVLARIGAVGSALGLWAAQHLLGGLRDPTQLLLAWAVFLGAFGASLLLAAAYSRALAGVLARPWGLAGDASGEAA